MKTIADNRQSKKWISFGTLVLGAGTIYKLGCLKDAFYVPMQEFMGLSHTQIGTAMSVAGLISTFGFLISIYLTDRVSKKVMIPMSLMGIGLLGIGLSTFPPYWLFLLINCGLAVCADMLYWPTMLKTVRLLGSEEEQGRMFGIMEAGRGLVDTVIAFGALGVFALLGSNAASLKAAILFYSAVPMVIGIIAYFLLEPDEIKAVNAAGEKVSRNKAAMDNVMLALKNRNIWLVSFNVFSVYCVYCGLTYFIPFLTQIYFLPATAVGMYGIINQYGLKMVGGPIGGFMSDKVHKSSAKHIRAGFVVCIIAMALFLMVPHESLGQGGNWIIGAACTLAFGAIVFTMRAVFFAPMDEVRVPKEITGAAMSLASLVIYLPNAFAYVMYGSFLDRYPGMAGFRIVFSVMIGWAVIGVGVSTFLIHRIKKCQAAAKAE
mgnify:CR=1 FL=1